MSTVVINSDAITVDSTVYTSEACANLLKHFGVSQLTIDVAVVTPDDEDSQNLSITGNVELFSIALTNVELYLDFSVPQTFHFQFSGTFPSLQLSTLQTQQLFPMDGLAHLDELLNISFPGMDVIFDSENDTLYFGAVESTAQLTALAAYGLALTKVGFELLQVYAENQATFVLYAVITLGQTEIDTQIQIPLGGPLSAHNWTLSIDTTLQLSAGLQDLVAFLEGTNFGQKLGIASFHDLFPDAMHQIPTIFLDVLELQFNPFTLTFSSLLLQFSSVHPLQIGDNLFSVEEVGARLFLDLVNNSVSTTLCGAVKMGDEASIDVAIALPANIRQDDWTFTLDLVLYLNGLADIAGLPINTPLGDLSLPHTLLTITDLRLNTFEVDFNPLNLTVASIQVAVALYASCQIGELLVSDPSLSLSITNPFSNTTLPARELDGEIKGTIGVDTLNFELTATKKDQFWSFVGKSEPGALAIGELLVALGNQFHIQLPDFVGDIELDSVALTFNSQGNGADGITAYNDTIFTCSGKLPTQSTELDIELSIEVKKSGASYTRTLAGTLTIGSRAFTLLFSDSGTASYFIASYANKGGEKFNLKNELAAYLAPEIAQAVPQGLEIDFKDILLVYSKQGTDAENTQATFLLALDIGATIPSLANLPLVGKELPADQTIAVNNLRIIVGSQNIKQSFVQALNPLLPDGITHLAETDLGAGLALMASMMFGSTPQALTVPVVSNGATPTSPPAQQTGVTAADNAQWFTLQKAFGPVYFNRVGLQYKDAALLFLLDASLSAFGLTISLDGLAFGSPLSKFAPTFDLRGLGIDYRSSDMVEITGAFLNAGNDEFLGEALIKTSELTLSALGSYASLNGNPSMFVYAFLDQPIGGPPFFFVTGLAVGFGYNRTLIMPPIEQISQFPLIEDVMSKTRRTLGDELKALDHYIPPSTGDLFFAIGVRFTSFKIIDSFALLSVEPGNHVEVGVLGLSTLISPPPEEGKVVPPLAEIYMALKASFSPEEGFLGINAQLTSASYLFSKDCHLVGGFAFYSWFAKEHAGDFVTTLGGYHPAFSVPDHYPKVPRLGFSWQVDSNLLMKGDLYYALTGSAIMAGGNLEVTWNSGPFKAWFNVGADFLLAWKPYHYDASCYVNIGASYTFELAGTHHITVDVGANVHLWGPDFSGLAHVDLSIISFDITFGRASSKAPDPIGWSTFQESFLPDKALVCSIAVKGGLISAPQTGDIQWVLNPKELDLVVGSVIPVNAATFNNRSIDGVEGHAFGIGSMEIKADDIVSRYDITITSDSGQAPENELECIPVLKNMPAGLWGEEFQPDLKAATVIPDVLAGFEIRPKNAPATGETVEIDPTVLHSTPDPLAHSYAWHSPIAFAAMDGDEEALRDYVRTTIAAPRVVSARGALLDALGLDMPVNVGADVASAFLVAPQVVRV